MKEHVKALESVPESGQALERLKTPNVREIIFGNYRIIYRFTGKKIEVVTVVHGARLFDENTLEST
jgi:toxin ParE1/3/4